MNAEAPSSPQASPRSWRERAVDAAPTLIGAVLLLAALALQLREPAAVDAFRNRVFDLYQAIHPRAYRSVPVRFLDIDEDSLASIGRWPWPRTVLARALERLAALGVSTVALDIAFTSPDASSPENLVSQLPSSPERDALTRRLRRLPTHDQLLAKAFGRLRVVTGFFLSGDSNDVRPSIKGGFARLGDDPLQFLPDFPGAIANLPVLEKAAAGSGGLSVLPESDGVMRRVPLLYRRDGQLYPGLALEALRVWQDEPAIAVQSSGSSGAWSFGQRTGISRVRVGAYSFPTDAQGRVWVRYAAPEPGRRLALRRLLEEPKPPGNWKGALVVVGASAPRLKDLFATPLSPAQAGAEIHAEIIEQALTGSFLRRPDWARGAETLYLLAIGVALIVLLPRLGAAACGLVGLGFVALAFAASWAAYRGWGFLLDPLLPALAALILYLASSLLSHLRDEAERSHLEVLDRVKDELVATVSHDLRGPVNSMITVTEMILQGVYGPLTDKQRRHLTLLKESGRRLTGFVANILDTAKIRAGRMEFHMAEVRLQEALPAVTELYHLSAASKGLALDHRVAPDLEPALADREKLEQVINNLVGNSMKFTPKGGRITLAAEKDGDWIRVGVTDTGPGIAPENIGRLFQKFQQLDLARQKENKIVGTGLGLAICKTIVEAHGGRIWAQSEGVGKGASFLLTLPIFRPVQPAESA